MISFRNAVLASTLLVALSSLRADDPVVLETDLHVLGRVGIGTETPQAAVDIKGEGTLLLGENSFTAEIGASGTGDLTISLGSYALGSPITIDVQVTGVGAEVGGSYHLAGASNALPSVLVRSEQAALSDRLRFHGQIQSGRYHLFATWKNTSSGGASVNDATFKISASSVFDPDDAGTYALASPLASVLTVNSGGNVGIGTGVVPPSEKLEVVGNAKVSGTLTVGSVTLPDGTLSSAKPTALYNSAGASVATVDTSGNVQIANNISGWSWNGGSIAIGVDSQSDQAAVAIGVNAEAFALATAIGWDSSALGFASISLGGQALDDEAIAIGRLSEAHHISSTAIAGGKAMNIYSVAIGDGSESIGWSSFAVGSYTKASGAHSSAMGFFTESQSAGSYVVGAKNVPHGSSGNWVPTDDLFVIGNGISWPHTDYYPYPPLAGNPSNAFVVHKNGNTRAQGTVEAQGGFRTPPMGDISMGAFTASPNPIGPGNTPRNPAILNLGLRYADE